MNRRRETLPVAEQALSWLLAHGDVDCSAAAISVAWHDDLERREKSDDIVGESLGTEWSCTHI